MKQPLRYQITEYDCGPTSLLNAVSFLFGREDIPPELVRLLHVLVGPEEDHHLAVLDLADAEDLHGQAGGEGVEIDRHLAPHGKPVGVLPVQGGAEEPLGTGDELAQVAAVGQGLDLGQPVQPRRALGLQHGGAEEGLIAVQVGGEDPRRVGPDGSRPGLDRLEVVELLVQLPAGGIHGLDGLLGDQVLPAQHRLAVELRGVLHADKVAPRSSRPGRPRRWPGPCPPFPPVPGGAGPGRCRRRWASRGGSPSRWPRRRSP